MFRDDKTCSNQLFAFTVRDFVPENSDVYLYCDLFEHLDLEDFTADYSSQGEAAVHPELMLRTIIYGLTHGIVSGRKLATACRFDTRFLILSGEQMPDARTFQRFIDRHETRLTALFTQVVRLAQKMGLVKLGQVAIDGSKFKANTSRNKAMSYGRMLTTLEALEHELKQLKESLAKENTQQFNESTVEGEIARRERRREKILAAKQAIERERRETEAEIDPKKQKSFHDLEALPHFEKNKGMSYIHNMVTAVDAENQVILSCELYEHSNDQNALAHAVKQVRENTGGSPNHVLADAGFGVPENMLAVENAGSVPVIAMAKGVEKIHVREVVRWDAENEKWRCPKGKALRIHGLDGARQQVEVLNGFCIGCPKQRSCPLFEKQGAKFSLPEESLRASEQRNRERLRSEEGKALYKRRKAIVEAPFGNMKNKGMRILVRGRKKVATRFKLFAMAHNLEKIVAAWVSAVPC